MIMTAIKAKGSLQRQTETPLKELLKTPLKEKERYGRKRWIPLLTAIHTLRKTEIIMLKMRKVKHTELHKAFFSLRNILAKKA